MNLRKAIIPIGGILVVTLPFWIFIPVISYLFEIALAFTLIMGVIERRLAVLGAAAFMGLIIGAVPGVAPLPLAVFFPLWLKAVIPPFLLGFLVNRGWKAGRSFMVASALGAIFVFAIYSQGEQIIVEQIDNLIMSLTKTAETTLSARGYSSEIINEAIDNLAYTGFLVKRLLPAMLILSGLGQLFVTFLLVGWYYASQDSYFPGFGPFIYWKMTEKLLFFLGAAILIRLTLEGSLKLMADNTLFILATLYAVCGLALIEHLLRRLQLPFLIKIVFYVGLFLMHIPGMIVASVAGLFDSFFDFRKIRAHSLG